MLSQTLKRHLVYPLLVASFALSAASPRSQERRGVPIANELPVAQGSCPKPVAVTLTASPPSFFAGDFTQGPNSQLSSPHMTALGQQTPDHNFLYTFQWAAGERCCQITRAVLTVKMKSILGGQTTTSSDAGNDGIAIMYQGQAVAPYNEAVYSGIPRPFNPGQLATKQWVLNQAALNIINTQGHLSFAVQDDTSVVSATLQLTGCCLTTPRRETAEGATITGSAIKQRVDN
jgi:hypothetical protein